MYVNERDQINFHGFLKALREMHGITQEHVSKGICTISGMNRFENGNRNAEKLMRDRLTARLGISGEKYEDYLQPREYVRWEQRLRIVKAIESKDLHKAKQELEDYKTLDKLNRLNYQFIETMYFQIMSTEGASDEELLEYINKAVKRTVPNVKKALAGEHLLADQEVNLIAEQIRLSPPKKVVRDEKEWRISEYEKLISYIDNSLWEKLLQAKVYPKLAYYIGKLLLEKETTETELRRGLELCHNAIELLRDCSRLYYFIELTETRRALATRLMEHDISPEEKADLEEMLKENNQWEMVLKELYAEYKVEPYMSDFCYLYYENESHNMVEVIEARRTMLGLSRVRLGEGICTERTIVRFEREGNNPNVEMVRCLFEKMGMCAEYRRTRVVTNDVNALMLSMKIGELVNNYDFLEWEIDLKELEKRLDLAIAHNKQQIIGLNNLLRLMKKEISSEEYHDRNIEAFECSVPITTLIESKRKYYTREELNWIFNQAFEAKGELTEYCISIVKNIVENMNNNETDISRFCLLELLINGYESYLGNQGQYEKSIELGNYMLKECLRNRSMDTVPNNLYNNIWSYQEHIKLMKSKVDIKIIRSVFNQCIIISDIIHKSNWKSFFQQKLEETFNI